MANVLFRQPFPFKYVPEMTLAVAADNLHTMSIRVRIPRDGSWYLVIKRGPSTATVELMV